MHGYSGLRAEQAFGRGAGEFCHLVGAGAVAEREYGLDAKFLALLEQGTAGLIHAAVENRIGFLAPDFGQDRLEIGGSVGGFLAGKHFDAGGFQGLFDFIGEPFAIGTGVIDYRNRLGLAFCREITRDGWTLLVVAADGTEHDFETLFRKRRIGR